MRTRRFVGVVATVAAVTALAVGATVAAVAANDATTPGRGPVAAATGDAQDGWGWHRGGRGQGRAGMADGEQPCLGRLGGGTQPLGVLTAEQAATLAAMAEEEKMAYDLYAEFAARYDDPRFDRVAGAETRHLEAVRSVLTRYEVADPTVGVAAGSFPSAAVQKQYDEWLAAGGAGVGEALAAAAELERADIADLEAAADGLDAPDVERLYAHLLRGSQRHLAVFTS